MTLKKRHISFAWGPLGGGEPRHVAALEFAVTAGQGGKGTVWIEDLRLVPLPPPDSTGSRVRRPAPRAARGTRRARRGRRRASTAWTSAPGDAAPGADAGPGRDARVRRPRDRLGAGPRRHATTWSSSRTTAATWQEGHAVRGGNGGRDYVWLPESEARWLRIRTIARRRAGQRRGHRERGGEAARVVGHARELLRRDRAGRAARAPTRARCWARTSSGPSWAQDFDSAEGLVDEVGRLETGKGAFSIEPFLRDRGRLLTWTDVHGDAGARGRRPADPHGGVARRTTSR